MEDRKLLGLGFTGAAAAAICCFTPLVVMLLAAVGLSAAIGWLDSVLLPALAAFVGIVIFAVVRQRRRGARACGTSSGSPRHV